MYPFSYVFERGTWILMVRLFLKHYLEGLLGNACGRTCISADDVVVGDLAMLKDTQCFKLYSHKRELLMFPTRDMESRRNWSTY